MQQVQGAGLFWSGRNAAESRDCRAAGGFQPHMHTALILDLTIAQCTDTQPHNCTLH